MVLKLLKMRRTGGMSIILLALHLVIRDNPIILFFRFDYPAIGMAHWTGSFLRELRNTGQNFQQRRLPGTIPPDNSDNLTFAPHQTRHPLSA
jgi:hypothetical protein